MKTLMVLVSLLALSASEEDWRNKYKNSLGVPCCGVSDCKILRFEEILTDGKRYIFMDGNIPVQVTAVHMSEDGLIWGCSTGCLFMPASS